METTLTTFMRVRVYRATSFFPWYLTTVSSAVAITSIYLGGCLSISGYFITGNFVPSAIYKMVNLKTITAVIVTNIIAVFVVFTVIIIVACTVFIVLSSKLIVHCP